MNDAGPMETAGIYARQSPYLGRTVQIGVAGGKLISVSFPEEPDSDASDEHPLLDRIFEYLEGLSKPDFADIDIGLTVATDHRTILETLREVPYGEDISVESLARMTPGFDSDDRDDLAAIRTALDENPLPLVIPDHRVRNAPSGAPPKVEQQLRSLEGLT